MDNNQNNYIEDDNGDIYKIINYHYLKLTPCEPSKKYVNEIEDDSYHIISYGRACMIINKQWNALPEHWNYQGEKFLANCLNITGQEDIEEHIVHIRLLPDHSIVVDDEGPSILKMVRSKGKMYYILLINEKLPRVKAYDMFGKFVQWLGIKNCKPVWNEDKKCFM